MWQRIQTVFLIISIIALLISLVQPVWILRTEEGVEAVLTPFYLLKEGQHLYMPYSITALLAVTSITLSITSIRKFKTRMVQARLGTLNAFILFGVYGSAFYFGRDLIQEYQAGQYSLGFFLPGISVVSNFLANIFIRRDERLVKESERLR